MNDDFEQRLRQQPLKQVPASWRGAIVSAARSAAATSPAQPDAQVSLFSELRRRIAATLWPCPQAWAALGVAWALIVATHVATRDNSPPLARSGSPSLEMIQAIRQEELLMAEWAEPFASSAAKPPPKPALNSPRSEYNPRNYKSV